ncbi:MAG TPA: ACP S-malonyltransferase [Anaerolineae bacterium]|nr:ACP S-malonyltransferase [Anaerolineae bacterium]HQI86019.1 ACP S-malonyltransferase [Anaerolineae bacterium]
MCKGKSSLFAGLIELGWTELLDLKLTTFAEQELPEDSTDALVWRYCQDHHLVLLTANRSMHEPESLEATLRQSNSPEALPVITLVDPQRMRFDTHYRRQCVLQLAEILFDLDSYRGCQRLFIP